MSCRGHRHRALIARGLCERNLAVATLWPSPTIGTLGGRRFWAEEGGGNQGWRRDGPLESIEGSNQAGAGHSPLGRWKGQTQAGGGHRPLEPMEGPDSPLPWFWLDARRSDPLRVARIQGTASGQQNDRFGPA